MKAEHPEPLCHDRRSWVHNVNGPDDLEGKCNIRFYGLQLSSWPQIKMGHIKCCSGGESKVDCRYPKYLVGKSREGRELTI